MPDLDVDWGGDFVLTGDGDLGTVDAIDLDNQHIIRRLLTAAQAYLFNLPYGAGLPQRVGRVATDLGIKAVIRSQIQLEASVARVPIPKITVSFPTNTSGLCSIRIDYTDAITGLSQEIALEIPTGR